VILSDPRTQPAATRNSGRATLDQLLSRAAVRRPDALALLDAPNRESITGGKPRRLSYRQADRMVSAIAGRLRRIGLHTDAIVAIQMANTVENVLTILGVLRAGLIPMPLPLLWRRTEMVAALSRVAATALIVTGRVGATDHYELAMQVAAEIFPIRYVCGYGSNAPDGLVSFDDLFVTEKLDPIPAWDEERTADPGPGAHLALITWDVSADGLIPVARSHTELIAGGLAVTLESRLRRDAVLLSTLTLASIAGLATAMVPWLLVGGTLALHQPFDPEAYGAQLRTTEFDSVVVPGPLAIQLAENAGPLTSARSPDVVAVWRAPERLTEAPPWHDPNARMTDILVFGEIGLIAACRGPDGKLDVIPFGTVPAPRAPKGSTVVGEIAATSIGTVAMRGPMVPRGPFPPGAERSGLPYLKVSASGFVDTGYACRSDLPALVVTGPPPGMISIGGYRFMLAELQEAVDRMDGGSATVAVLPDALAGHRVTASAADCESMQAMLRLRGANPLLVGAFGIRNR
jgi:hypothetical protein